MAHYVLDDLGNPVESPDLLAWARTMDDIELRRVARTTLSDKTTISTVFLGIDYGRDNPPLLFETLVGEVEARYPTWADALKGHRMTVAHLLHEGGGKVFVKTHEEQERPKQPLRSSVWERLTAKDEF